MIAEPLPTEHTDSINAKILEVSEDQIKGFHRHPFHFVAERSGLPLETVLERIQAMLRAGVIRRVRQTLLANKLADGGLVAWKIPGDKIDAAFDFMVKEDPFSGHVVLRSTDREVSGSDFKLWTTIKVPQGREISEHADALMRLLGAEEYIIMQPKGIFALGVGHVRRKTMEIGDKSDEPAEMITPDIVDLDKEEWDVLVAMKRDLTPEEIVPEPWVARAAEAGVSVDRFCEVAEGFDRKGILGRFSTFLEHVKPSQTGVRVTKFNALFHWRVPEGMQQRAGSEVGRHHIMTHAYWREGGPRFANANIMGVVHGTDKARVLEHKAAIDRHLESIGIPVLYTNVFWGGRSEIKPSEISPKVYAEWHDKYRGQSNII
ncbi:Lrp/AsnC family transcriptional regulator [Verrucomicrobium sp. BvORR034]|uniref:Lrp/AsnC family transcriptional regulator n=1 Tax=Verrucomicrobium sp. BvORR034 TaxID=1396418 RepID=UPI00067910AB|nr:Lrp/AsnC family transcriptional regulator [Verrucomicrobium sp. BvORR034]